MERENNFKEFNAIYGTETDMPTSGAGSEYGREQREQARRKKFGFKARQYDPKSQPFILKMASGKEVKKMKGTKNGGVVKNAGYMAFVLTPQKNFVALPVSDWYNFAPVSKRATLSIEEAEEQFQKRDKIYNHFALMANKKSNVNEKDDDDFDGKPAKSRKRCRSSKKEEIETLSDDDDERDSDDEGPSDDNKKNKKRRRNDKSDDENNEVNDEDDGVNDGVEVDYMSDASDDDDDEDDFFEGIEELMEFGGEEDEQEKDNKNDDDDEEETEKDVVNNGDDSDSDEDVDSLFGPPSGSKGIAPPVSKVETKDGSADKKRKSDGPESVTKKPKLESIPANIAIESMEDCVRDCLKKKPTSASELMKNMMTKFSKSYSMDEIKKKLVEVMKKVKPKTKNNEGTIIFSL